MLKLDELASRAGVSPRTVRYYIQRGVLPPASFRGPDTSYDERHLQALRAIKRLQEDYLPLDAIASALEGKSESELKKIADKGLGAKPPRAAIERPLDVRQGERVTLSKGIELWIDQDADRSLVEEIITLVRSRPRGQ